MSEYAPGTMAVAIRHNGDGEFLVVRTRGGEAGDYWSAPKGWPAGVSLCDIDDYRPLVVIDPEDAKQVERLMNAVLAPLNDRILTAGIRSAQAALREFANPTPPKPEEPTGLGAVVEDRDGVQYVRIQTDYSHPWVRRGVAGQVYGWHEFAAVRVLSEGFQ